MGTCNMKNAIFTRDPIAFGAFAALTAAASVLTIGAALMGPAGAAELKWTFEKVGEGIKPAIALDAGNAPHIPFLTEEIPGAAFYTPNKPGQWTTPQS